MPLSSRPNFKAAGELFVVLSDGQRKTARVRIRHPLSVHFRFLRERPAVVRIM
jgi:NADH:ubiquinone oxidoreductase subunit D